MEQYLSDRPGNYHSGVCIMTIGRINREFGKFENKRLVDELEDFLR